MTDIKERPINPYDPFNNPSENCAYKENYSEIDPRISQPGYEIPLLPDKKECKGIRRYINAVGLAMFIAVIAVNVAFIIITAVLEAVMSDSLNYDALMEIENYINYGSAIGISLNGLLFLISNLLSAVIGSRATGIRIRSYFRPAGVSKGTIAKYAVIGLFIQAATGIIYTIVSSFMDSLGVQDFTPDIDSYSSFISIVATFLYSCIIAPVTEELLYRGFALKNLSRVSQNFGIIVSSILFGLAHENIAQFLLALPVGIFMARITIKHNSIIPSIAVHVTVNTVATVINMLMEFYNNGSLGDFLMYTVDILYYLAAAAGLVFWIMEVRKNRLPANTVKQSYRTIRIALTSPWLIATAVFHFAMALLALSMAN